MSFLNELEFEHWLSVGSAGVALVSFLFNLHLIRKQEKREVESLRLQKDQDLIDWAGEAIDVLSGVQQLLRERGKLYDPDDFLKERSQLRTRLSAVIDKGRLFFPSAHLSESEFSTETAYVGSSDPVIAALETAERILKAVDLTKNEYVRETVLELVAARRQFVSSVFNAVDPRRRAKVFKEFIA